MNTTTTTTAAAEAAKNLRIYGLMAEVARKAFEYLTIAPGEYTAPQVVTALKKSRAQWTDDAPGVADPDGLAAIACEGFECKYPLQMAFEVLAQVAHAYDIPTAERVTFERAAEAAPVLLTLNVPTAAKEVAKAVSKKDTGTPALTFAYYDAERRALVGTNRQVLTVAAAPFAEVAPEAADRKGFFIPVSLLRSDRVTIDTNNNATDGHKVAESPEWYRFPNWVSIFPQVYDTDALTLDKTTARQLTKAVATAAKSATAETGPNGLTKYVAIFGEAYTDRLTVRARHLVGDHFEYNDTTVQLAAELSRSFALAVSGDDFATLPTFDTIFVPAHHRPAIVKSAHAVALIFALTLPEGFETICDTDTPPTWAKAIDPLAEVLDVFKPCPLTAETIESEPQADTIPAAAETPAEVATAETPAAPTCEAVESVESVEPCTIKAEAIESHSEPESEPQAERPEWLSEGRAAAYYDTDRRAWLVGTIEAPRYWPTSGEWAADFRHGHLFVIGVPAAQLHPATAEPFELTPEILRAMKTAAKSETTRPASESETNRATFFLWSQGVRKAGEWFTLRATGEVVARVVLTYGKKTRALDCPCTGARVEPLTWPTPDTCETIAADSVATAETIETPEAVTFGEYCPLTGEYLTDTGVHLTPEELADLVARERERLTATPEADTIATATTCEAVESVESVAPADTKADTIEAVSEPENEPQGDTLTTDPEAIEAVEVAPVWASRYAIACELPTADGIESEPTPQADTLTPPPADTIESEGETVAPVLTIERPRHHWHRRAVRVALRVAALIAAALLLTLTPDRVETIEAETVAPVAIADTLRATGEPVESVETVAPDTIKADTCESHSEPRKHATGHRPDRLAPVAPADTIKADTIAAPADLLTIEAVELTADTLTADTIATAQTIEGEGEAVEVAESVEGEPQGDTLTTGTPETIEATGEAVESVESPEGDPATTGTTGTPSPTSTPATGGTPSPAAVGTPAPVPAAVALALLLML